MKKALLSFCCLLSVVILSKNYQFIFNELIYSMLCVELP